MDANHLGTTNASTSPSGAYIGGTPGLSSPSQLVDVAASVSFAPDQTASGAELLLFPIQPPSDRATQLAEIRRHSFERLGNAWRALAGQ